MSSILPQPTMGHRHRTAFSPSVEQAIGALGRGEPVLIFDDPSRERETDMVVLAEQVFPETVRLLRQEAGGLLCVTIPMQVAGELGLGLQQDLLREMSPKHTILSQLLPETLPYDRRSAFGLWVNHRNTYTGVSDQDRALTIREIGNLTRDSASLVPSQLKERFIRDFMIPGHVPLLHPAANLLGERKGHTEFSTVLALLGNLTPSLALMEMLSEDGGALQREEARKRALDRGWAFVDGMELTQAWSRWSE